MTQLALGELPLRFADLAFPGQKDQNVAAWIERRHRTDRIGHRFWQIELGRGRLVQYFDGISATFDLNHGRALEELGEALRLDRGGADQELELGPFRQNALEPAEEKIDGEAAL